MEINGVVEWLFKWWLITSAVLWGFVGVLYCTVYYVAHRGLPKAQ